MLWNSVNGPLNGVLLLLWFFSHHESLESVLPCFSGELCSCRSSSPPPPKKKLLKCNVALLVYSVVLRRRNLNSLPSTTTKTLHDTLHPSTSTKILDLHLPPWNHTKILDPHLTLQKSCIPSLPPLSTPTKILDRTCEFITRGWLLGEFWINYKWV